MTAKLNPESVSGNRVTFGDTSGVKVKADDVKNLISNLDKLSQAEKLDLIIKQNDLIIELLKS